MRCCMSIAGSDCSGGAGIQADLKTFAANGVYGTSVITSVVAENTNRVLSVWDMDIKAIEDQIDAVFEDIPIDAVKLGMLKSAPVMHAVAKKLLQYKATPVVTDPVMHAKDGCALVERTALAAMRETLIPLTFLLTPNIPEAQVLSGMQIETQTDMQKAAEKLWRMGAANVLVKGGHLPGDPTDVLFDGERFSIFKAKRIVTPNTHGTGCTLSSAIAAGLARGMDVKTAVQHGKHYVTQAILHALPIGKGHGPTHHFYAFYDRKGVFK